MRPNNHNGSWFMRLLRWRLMLPINLIIIGFVGWSYSREASRGAEVSAQLASLKQEIAQLDRQNSDYDVLLGKLGTSGFVEREARLKLGYQKPGEQTLILRDASATPDTPAPRRMANAADQTNPQKWWNYFFGAR